ncbi:caprin-2-like [Saccostrea echinata]|uniref:caprin-2-like n=1 Tax=Saccostrea echinata TaxID=191078 RepID=UPI002A804787|nr:caprin-2-like [Saccostrea echinata]
MEPGKENQGLKRTVLQLQEMIFYFNIQMDKVMTRVSKLESTNQRLSARLTAMENKRDYKVSEKEKDMNTLFGKNVKSTEDITLKENILQSSPTKGEQFMKARWNFPMTNNKNQPTKFKSSQKTNPFMNKTQNVSVEKRLLTGVQTTNPPFPTGVAFSAYISSGEKEISQDHTIIFDVIVTNIGNHYNPHSGIFTAPQHGVYVFTWNLYCKWDGYMFSQVLVNANDVSAMRTSGEGATSIRTTTGVVVVEVNQGDVVFVRIHPTQPHSGTLKSDSNWRSSFNGWKIY